jgi:hypothetical protein
MELSYENREHGQMDYIVAVPTTVIQMCEMQLQCMQAGQTDLLSPQVMRGCAT